MKLKCYLRGIGLGILVTAALFLCAGFKKEGKMTDEQVMARAKELGMIDNQYLADYTYPSDKAQTEATSAIEQSEMETEVTSAIEQSETETEAISTIEHSEAETEATPAIEQSEIEIVSQPETADSKTVTIIVNKGDGSDTVSRKALNAGIIEDSVAFDRFLMENGYDRKITTGSHEIPQGATFEQIAKILCGK